MYSCSLRPSFFAFILKTILAHVRSCVTGCIWTWHTPPPFTLRILLPFSTPSLGLGKRFLPLIMEAWCGLFVSAGGATFGVFALVRLRHFKAKRATRWLFTRTFSFFFALALRSSAVHAPLPVCGSFFLGALANHSPTTPRVHRHTQKQHNVVKNTDKHTRSPRPWLFFPPLSPPVKCTVMWQWAQSSAERASNLTRYLQLVVVLLGGSQSAVPVAQVRMTGFFHRAPPCSRR